MRKYGHTAVQDCRRGRIPYSVATIAMLLMFMTPRLLLSQSYLEIQRVVNDWPYIGVFLHASCDTSAAMIAVPENIQLYDEGQPVEYESLWCPDVYTGICRGVSVVMLLHANEGMTETTKGSLARYGTRWLGRYHWLEDEVAVLYSTDTIDVAANFIRGEAGVYDAIFSHRASNDTGALIDNIHESIEYYLNNKKNECGAIIVIASGNSGVSNITVEEVARYAVQNGVRIYTIGSGDYVEEEPLIKIAELTSGVYYRSPSDYYLDQLQSQLKVIVADANNVQCTMIYKPSCADGKVHEISAYAPDLCRGLASNTAYYASPLDTSTVTVLPFALGAKYLQTGDTAIVPLVYTGEHGVSTAGMDVQLLFDPAQLQYLKVFAGDNASFKGAAFQATAMSDTLRVSVLDDATIAPGDTCFSILFAGKDIPTADQSSLSVLGCQLEEACTLPIVSAGTVKLFPDTAIPILHCELQPEKITVDEKTDTYNPMPFPLHCRVRNVGGGSANAVYATIQLPRGLQFAEGDSLGQITKKIAYEALGRMEFGDVSWRLTHPVAQQEKKYFVEVFVWSQNTPMSSCSMEITIPPVDINPFQAFLTADGSLDLCPGASVTLDAGTGYAAYLWNTGEDSQRLTTTHAGEYFCRVTDSEDMIGYTDTVVVRTHENPHTRIDVFGDNPMCSNKFIWLDTAPVFIQHRWNTGETSHGISVTKAGVYYAEIQDSIGCWGVTDTIRIEVIPAPAKPEISRTDDILHTSPAFSYQWIRDDEPIEGETSQQFHVAAAGIYQVRVFNENGCSEISDPYPILVLDVSETPSAQSLTIETWPQPVMVGGMMRVAIAGARNESYILSLSDMLGRERLSRTLETGEILTLDVTGTQFTPGSYILRAVSADGRLVSRLVSLIK